MFVMSLIKYSKGILLNSMVKTSFFTLFFNFALPKNDRWRNFMPMVLEEGASASSLFFRVSNPQKQAKELPQTHIVR